MSFKFALKAMVFALAGAVLVFVLVGQVLASEWRVETTRVVRAPATAVGALLADLGSWSRWSSVDFNLGMPTRREVRNPAGEVGHCAVWTGPLGEAMLRITAVAGGGAEGHFDYEIRYLLDAQGTPVGSLLTGTVGWADEGDECRVRWTEKGVLTSLAQRWSHWFGALQEKVRHVQGESLLGLEDELRKPKPPAGDGPR